MVTLLEDPNGLASLSGGRLPPTPTFDPWNGRCSVFSLLCSPSGPARGLSEVWPWGRSHRRVITEAPGSGAKRRLPTASRQAPCRWWV